jgi:hypothetical protein
MNKINISIDVRGENTVEMLETLRQALIDTAESVKKRLDGSELFNTGSCSHTVNDKAYVDIEYKEI